MSHSKPAEVIPPHLGSGMVSFNNDSAGEDAEALTNFLTRNGVPTFCTRLFCRNMTGSWRKITKQGAVSCVIYMVLLTKQWQESKECQASGSYLDLSCEPYVSYGVKYIDQRPLCLSQFETEIAENRYANKDGKSITEYTKPKWLAINI